MTIYSGRIERPFNLTYNKKKNPYIIITFYIIDAFKLHNNLKKFVMHWLWQLYRTLHTEIVFLFRHVSYSEQFPRTAILRTQHTCMDLLQLADMTEIHVCHKSKISNKIIFLISWETSVKSYIIVSIVIYQSAICCIHRQTLNSWAKWKTKEILSGNTDDTIARIQWIISINLQ